MIISWDILRFNGLLWLQAVVAIVINIAGLKAGMYAFIMLSLMCMLVTLMAFCAPLALLLYEKTTAEVHWTTEDTFIMYL